MSLLAARRRLELSYAALLRLDSAANHLCRLPAFSNLGLQGFHVYQSQHGALWGLQLLYTLDLSCSNVRDKQAEQLRALALGEPCAWPAAGR